MSIEDIPSVCLLHFSFHNFCKQLNFFFHFRPSQKLNSFYPNINQLSRAIKYATRLSPYELKINDEKPRPPRIKKFKRLSRSTPKPRTTTVKNTLLTNKNDQKMAFVVRNSFSFGPNSIQVGVPESTEVVEDNSIVIGKPMKENGKLLFFSHLFCLGPNSPALNGQTVC